MLGTPPGTPPTSAVVISNGDSSSHHHPQSPNVFLPQQRQTSHDNTQNLTVSANHLQNGIRRHSGSNSQQRQEQYLGAERERRKLSANSSMSTSALIPTGSNQPQSGHFSQFKGNPSPSHSSATKKELQKVASAPSMEVSSKNQQAGSQQQPEASGSKNYPALLEKRTDTSSSLLLGTVVVRASECATPNPASAITEVRAVD